MATQMIATLKRTLLIQSLVLAIAILVVAILLGLNPTLWALLGGLTAIIPMGVFGLMLRNREENIPAQFLRVFILGEVVKIGITVVLLIIIMIAIPKEKDLLIGLFSGFGSTLFAQILHSMFSRISNTNGGRAQ